MITSNVYHRIFQIRLGENTGTCFTIDIDNKQYLITARHVLDKWDPSSKGYLCHTDEWKELALTIAGIGTGAADIAVLTTNRQLSPNLPMEPTAAASVWGQDVYFLGFPYGWRVNVDANLNRGFPLPFVKKAIISCMYP
ncbi:MAG TPA: trypsin-like peptidase domain-containing protein, partial [Rhodanobacteraceae bacterium]